MSLLHDAVRVESLTVLSRFRTDFYDCLTARADALFELTDAVLCTDGPVQSLVDLALAPEHRRGHGALYAGLNRGGVDVARLRRVLAGGRCPGQRTAGWCWPSMSRRGFGRTPGPCRTGRSATPTAAAAPSTR